MDTLKGLFLESEGIVKLIHDGKIIKNGIEICYVGGDWRDVLDMFRYIY